jgi:hypothetical protein
MNDITDLRNFIATIIRPIINEAVKESLDKYNENKYSKQSAAQQLTDKIDIKTASELTGFTVSTLYSKVSRRSINSYKIHGSKKIWFSRSELLKTINNGRRETQTEIEERASDYMVKR